MEKDLRSLKLKITVNGISKLWNIVNQDFYNLKIIIHITSEIICIAYFVHFIIYELFYGIYSLKMIFISAVLQSTMLGTD